MKYIGLLMIANENDILLPILARHCEIVDAFYVLDGTDNSDISQIICTSFPECEGYARDVDLPRPPYPTGTTCGYRQFPYEMAVKDHGTDNWFLILHGDEVWTFDPRDVVAENPGADGFIFPLPCYFPRAEDGWNQNRPPLEQLKWNLRPGWPEFRMFKGSPDTYFVVDQHFNTRPLGVKKTVAVSLPINHYPYRSPAVQRERAAMHERTGFDPDNYAHILNGDHVLWDEEMIESHRQKPCFRELAHD